MTLIGAHAVQGMKRRQRTHGRGPYPALQPTFSRKTSGRADPGSPAETPVERGADPHRINAPATRDDRRKRNVLRVPVAAKPAPRSLDNLLLADKSGLSPKYRPRRQPALETRLERRLDHHNKPLIHLEELLAAPVAVAHIIDPRRRPIEHL
jgi:hypothetical protein